MRLRRLKPPPSYRATPLAALPCAPTRVGEPIRLDGRVDDDVYARVSPISDLVEIEPREGESATQKTEAWLLFDDEYVYVAARCWESRPDRMVASEMRRDNPPNYMGSDNVRFLLDTFCDRQNGIVLLINPAGGRNDGQVTNDRQWNGDWNPVYDFKVGRFEGGWTVEVAVPFKSLRYAPGRGQVWGFNVVHNNVWKNELSSITRMPAVVGIGGALRALLAATVVGIEAPRGSSHVEVKPAFVSHVSSDRAAVPVISNAVDADFGMDVKYGNHVELAEGWFTARLVGSRVTYTMTPRMFAGTPLQYNSATNTLSSNARLRWEYRPGSELFVVYDEQRDTLGVGVPGLSNRSSTVKVSRLLRF